MSGAVENESILVLIEGTGTRDGAELALAGIGARQGSWRSVAPEDGAGISLLVDARGGQCPRLR